MNLASFVDTTESYESFYTLLKYLLSFYEGTMKQSTSVFIVSGANNSGKTTMVKLIRCIDNLDIFDRVGTCEQLRKIDVRWLNSYPKCEAVGRGTFDGNIVSCDDFSRYDFDHMAEVVKKIHIAINDGLICRYMYTCEQTIQNPPVLIVVAPFLMVTPSDNEVLSRNIKQLHLPNIFKGHNPDIISKCLKEIREIRYVLRSRELWLKYKLYCLSETVVSFTEVCVDISTYIFHIISNRTVFFPSEISDDWWKIIMRIQ